MELSAVTAAVASAAAARPHRPFRSPRAATVSISWNSPSFTSTSSRCLSTPSRQWRLSVTSAAVELREAATSGRDSLRVTETPQPGSSARGKPGRNKR